MMPRVVKGAAAPTLPPEKGRAPHAAAKPRGPLGQPI